MRVLLAVAVLALAAAVPVAAEDDPARLKLAPALFVLRDAIPPLGVEHDPNLHTATMSSNDRVQQRRIGEHEHLDAQRLAGAINRVQDRLGGVVGQNNQITRHEV